MTLHKKYVNMYLHIAFIGQMPTGKPSHELLSKYEPAWKNLQTSQPQHQAIWAWRRADIDQTHYMRAERIVPSCWIIIHDDEHVLQACFANMARKDTWLRKSDAVLEKEIKFFFGITGITELESTLADVEDLFLERKR